MAVEDVNAPETVAALRALRPRLLAVVSFGQFIRREAREIALLGAVNLHYSLLPRWRGAAPVQRALLAGDAEGGVTIQRVTAKLDAGPVLARLPVAILPRDDAPALRARLTAAGAPLLADLVERMLRGETVAEESQDEAAMTLAPSIARAEGDLDFAGEDAAAIDRRVRALEPWPRCRAALVRSDGDPVEVFVREAVPEEGRGRPGEVVAAGADGIRVAARAGVLRVTRLQRAGGRDVDARAFLNGTRDAAGDRFERCAPASR
jgi:methionyl-tRNA formyltransferase